MLASMESSTRIPPDATMPAAECWARLAGAPVVRLALTERALPVIVAVRHRVVGDDLVFAVTGGQLLRAALAEDVVGIQADSAHEAWSVSGTGVLGVIDDPDRLRALRPLIVRPWDGRPVSHVARARVGA